ncbi:hypothetical protein T05_1375 [Trichinella murrelli]|uniref:Uncharacterized protein n=1 Tax=Trichinella murrelli TaxID=144512 RepID=A0A0V0U369_9BILA|nr:hypothetical protein T05_1375 [Trichinella murrelli]
MYDKLAVALKKCSILPVTAGHRKLRYVLRSPFHAYSHHLFAAPPSRFYPKLIKHQVVRAFVLFLSCGCANLPFHIVVNPHRHTMNIPKRNFIGRKPLPLEVPEQGFQLIRRPNIYDFKTRGSYAKPADLPKHSLAKVEEATLHSDIGKVALNSRDQVCFEIPKKFRRIKLGAKFFRFGKEHFKYPAIHGQIFPNSQAIYDGQ